MMQPTKHCLSRMSQRGITKDLLELVLKYGDADGDKLTLNRKSTLKVIEQLDYERGGLMHILDKGGLTLVAENDAFITAYNVNNYKRKA